MYPGDDIDVGHTWTLSGERQTLSADPDIAECVHGSDDIYFRQEFVCDAAPLSHCDLDCVFKA